MMHKIYCVVLSLLASAGLAQSAFSQHYVTRRFAGESATSSDSIFARSLHFAFPVYDYVADTAYGQLLFSCRQKGEGQENVYLNHGGFASLDCNGDTLNFKNETALYDLELTSASLLASKESRSVSFERRLGYDQQHFYSPILYTFKNSSWGLQYSGAVSDTLRCVNLLDGSTAWSAVVPREEDWADVRSLSDSVILVAASGISALHLSKGLIWRHPLRTAATNTGSLTYSLARNRTVKQISIGVSTRSNDSLISHLCSNILIRNHRIYFASRDEMLCLAEDGTVKYRIDLSDYDPAKSLLMPAPEGIYLVNFGLGVHAGNYVLRNTPYLLTADSLRGELVDQYDLKDIRNLADFMISARGLSFGGREKILEMTREQGFVKSVIPFGRMKYGAFSEFINGDEYFILLEGHYVPLNFINNKIVYFLADNNKIYGLEGDHLLYEYHFTELFRLAYRYGDKRILAGLNSTLITDRNFELLARLNISEKSVLMKDKLYFIDEEKIHIVDLRNIH